MKKITFFLLPFLGFFFSSLAQINNTSDMFEKNIKKIKSIEQFNAKKTTLTTTTLALDSSVIRPNQQVPMNYFAPLKVLYYYNEYGKDTLHFYYSRQFNTDPWSIDSKERFLYDNHNRLTETQSLNYDNSNGVWKGYYQNKYFYNSSDRVINQLNAFWDNDSNKYVDFSQYTTDYDNQGNIIKQTYYVRGYTSNLIEAQSKTEYSYTNQNVLMESIRFYVDPNTKQWEKSYKEVYQYDNNNKIVKSISLGWNINLALWDSSYMNVSEYDTAYNITKQLFYEYKQASWKLKQKQELNYTPSVNTWITSRLDTSTNQVELLYKTDNYKDQNGNTFLTVYHQRDRQNNSWVSNYKDSASFDLNINVNDVIYPHYSSIQYNTNNIKLSETSLFYDSSAMAWNYRGLKQHYYSQITIMSAQDQKESAVRIYPNPAESVLNIELSPSMGLSIIEIYDNQGRLIKSESIKNHSSISIDDLESGLYIYRISSKNQSNAGKFIVK